MFISDQIEPWFDEEPTLLKRTGVPTGFVWRGERHEIAALLAEWHDYSKSREPGNTRRTQATLDRQRGGWGTGRDYYRVRTTEGRTFDLYYDRRPRSREIIGSWILYQELTDGE